MTLAPLRTDGVRMQRFGQGRRRAAARLAVIDGFRIPDEVAERFRQEHPEVHPEDLALVEEGLRRWLRLLVGTPVELLDVPSRAVSDLWLALTVSQEAYAQLCDDAFGTFVPHRPPARSSTEGVGNAEGLDRTLQLALRDRDDDAVDGVPFLFAVDRRVAVLNGRRYLGTCGGGVECYPVAGAVCLVHLTARPRRTSGRRPGAPGHLPLPGPTADAAVRATDFQTP